MKRERLDGTIEWRVDPHGSINHRRPHGDGGQLITEMFPPKRAPVLSRLGTVLVPLDGTPAAEHALPYAVALARRSGAEVAVAHVYSTLQAANEPELLGWHAGQYLVEPCRDYLESLARRLA